MPDFNEDVNVNGQVVVSRPWSDWLFLRQQRDVEGNGGFHVHNPWGNSSQPQGAADRNRLEIGYRSSSGQDLWGQLVIHGPTGRVGIGTVSPQEKFVVAGGGARINGVSLGTDVAGINYAFEYETVGVAQTNFNLRLQSPNAIIFHTGGTSPAEKVIITADGDIRLLGADCAEFFEADDPATVEPGTVLVIGESGSLRACDLEYDKRVAGVVSGAGSTKPAIVLDQGAADVGVPVALTGKVHCKADAGASPIEVGDLLTTSSTTGHAMKASDAGRYLGSILGKALAPLSDGRGLIPVLVALH
jgi:hypothetical protein